MYIKNLKNQITLKKNIINSDDSFYSYIKSNINWDNSIISRKTASFGKSYNYSGINYVNTEIPVYLQQLVNIVNQQNNFIPNNCLINFYYDNDSKMGYHSDQIDILVENTGIAIFSLGSARIMRFKHKINSNLIFDLELPNNSYLYLSQESQIDWLHAILPNKKNELSERISITFRKIK